MTNHKDLDSQIDKGLFYNIINSKEKRQILSYIHLVHEYIFLGLDNAEDSNRDWFDTLILLFEHYANAEIINNELEDNEKLKELLWDFHLFKGQEKYKSIEDYWNLRKSKSLIPLFSFFLGDSGEITNYSYSIEELAKVLDTFFYDWNFNKLKNEIMELEQVRCLKYHDVTHNIVITYSNEDELALIYPNETYAIVNDIYIIYLALFEAEYYINYILNSISSKLKTLKDNLIKIFPIYMQNSKKIDLFIKKAIDLNRTNISEYLRENEDKLSESITDFIFIEPSIQESYVIDYFNELDKLLLIYYKFKTQKKIAEKKKDEVFSSKSRKYFSDFIREMGISQAREYRDEIYEILIKYQELEIIYQSLDIKKIEINYHKFALLKLGVEWPN